MLHKTQARWPSWRIYIAVLALFLLASCGPTQTDFAVVHLLDRPGDKITEVVSYETQPGLDNSGGAAPLQVQLTLNREYKYQIIDRITGQGVDEQQVRDKIIQLYKLPPNDPETAKQVAQCPLTIVVPAGARAIVTIEWTERWADGVINQGKAGDGQRLGTYSVFLGYVEPCSLVKQENKH